MFKKLLFLLGLLFTLTGHAYTPEAGLWVVNSENNGQPGRGFTLDYQGTTVVVALYAYLPNGSAQWYLAAGTLANNTFEGLLQTYQGGTYLGGPQVSAVPTGTAGTIKIDFSSDLTGTITLPGEAPKEVMRGNFARPADPLSLDGTYTLVRTVYSKPGTSSSGHDRFDSFENVSIFGQMRIDGKNAMQELSIIYPPAISPTTWKLEFEIIKDKEYFVEVKDSGYDFPYYRRLLMRGDQLVTLVNYFDDSYELEYWRRISADPKANFDIFGMPHHTHMNLE